MSFVRLFEPHHAGVRKNVLNCRKIGTYGEINLHCDHFEEIDVKILLKYAESSAQVIGV